MYLGQYVSNGVAYGIAVSGNYAYVINSFSGLNVIDIFSPYYPTLVGSYVTKDQVEDVVISGNYAYVANYQSGFGIYDISNPANPILTGSFDSLQYIQHVLVKDNYAYVSGFGAGVNIVDISNPTSPILRGDIPGPAWDVSISGNYAFVSRYNSGLAIYDISDLGNPVLSGYWRGPDYTMISGVLVSGNYTYIADEHDGFEILDVSNPIHPVLVSRLATLESQSVVISNGYAYLGARNNLFIVDISEPANPHLVQSYNPQCYMSNISLRGNYLYLANDGWGIKILDISNPVNPIMVDSYDTPGRAQNIASDDNYVYIADTYSLLVLRRNTTGIDNSAIEPSAFSLSSNYPNPFNAQTTISYSLNQAGPVSVVIYNIMGQKVAALLDGVEQAGEHKIVWDATDVPSAIYFARLETAEKSQSIKMMLLK
jgi:hypothetical protein